jgi:dCMP deaminase
MSWDEYFMGIAKHTSKKSKCQCRSGNKGAVIVGTNQTVLSMGFNGAPRNIPDCIDLEFGCNKEVYCIAVHAEANAIVQAARNGIKIEDSTIYITHSPCINCSKLIINSGIKEVVVNKVKPNMQEAAELLQQAGIICRVMEVPLE